MSWLMPISASVQAMRVDAIFSGLLVLAGAITILVFGLVLVFSIRYRRGARGSRRELPEFISREWEIGWTLSTLLLFLFLFWWAASANVRALSPPPGALEVHILAKQWMWESQQTNGAREINALHVPIDTPVRLLMTSQDVIHSFFVPAFRLKQDVLPGRDAPTQAWFQATKLGTFGLLCAEYCGTDHSVMRGKVIVMSKGDFAQWLDVQPEGDDLAHQGARLFVERGCSGCHAQSAAVHAPSLNGLFGRDVRLSDGTRKRADEAYIRDSILQPKRDVVAGYEPIMPSFSGTVTEGEIQALVAYIRSLADTEGEPR